MHYLAQSMTIGGQQIQGPLQGITTVGDLISKVTELIFPIAGLILLFVFILGGYDFMMSQGSADKMKSAWAKLTTGVIGFIILALSFLLVKLIERIFGLNTGIF